MPNNLIDQTLQVNLNHSTPAVPNTGFFEAIFGNLGGVGYTMLIAAIVALIASLVVFCIRKKVSHKYKEGIMIAGVSLLAVSVGFVIPTSAKVIEASLPPEGTTAITLNFEEGQSSATASQTTQLRLNNDYPDGYVVFAYTDADNKLYNEDKSAYFAPIDSSTTLNQFKTNSYGIQNQNQGYEKLSTERRHPTKVMSDADSTLAGLTIPVSYTVKADDTLPTGEYKSNGAAIHFEIQSDVYQINYVDYAPEGHIQEQKHNPTFVLETAPVKPGFEFVEYNTQADGTGIAYHPGDTLTLDYIDTTLYTIWKPARYEMIFDANNGQFPSGQTTTTITETYDTYYILPEVEPTRTEYTFRGWRTEDGSQVTSGTKVPVSASGTTIYAHWEKNSYTVHYEANGGTNIPKDEAFIVPSLNEVPSHTFTLDETTIPTRSGYTFGGWTTRASNEAAAYSPGSEVYLTDEHPLITLYAIWVPDSEMGFGSLTGTQATMQNMTSDVCQNVRSGTIGRLQDSRDYKIYYVMKEADGHCWMTQNLSLEISKNKTYTAADTNITVGGVWEPGESTSLYKGTIPTGHLVNDVTWKDDLHHPYSYNPADSYFTTNNDTSADDPETLSGNAHYATGNYYNWSAAVASNDTSGATAQYQTMPNSICPRGWRLPCSNGAVPEPSSEFGELLDATGVTSLDTPGQWSYGTDGFLKIRKDPLWLVRAGDVGSGILEGLGEYGGYWSGNVFGTDTSSYGYSPTFTPLTLLPLNGSARWNGRTVRCLAE